MKKRKKQVKNRSKMGRSFSRWKSWLALRHNLKSFAFFASLLRDFSAWPRNNPENNNTNYNNNDDDDEADRDGDDNNKWLPRKQYSFLIILMLMNTLKRIFRLCLLWDNRDECAQLALFSGCCLSAHCRARTGGALSVALLGRVLLQVKASKWSDYLANRCSIGCRPHSAHSWAVWISLSFSRARARETARRKEGKRRWIDRLAHSSWLKWCHQHKTMASQQMR